MSSSRPTAQSSSATASPKLPASELGRGLWGQTDTSGAVPPVPELQAGELGEVDVVEGVVEEELLLLRRAVDDELLGSRRQPLGEGGQLYWLLHNLLILEQRTGRKPAVAVQVGCSVCLTCRHEETRHHSPGLDITVQTNATQSVGQAWVAVRGEGTHVVAVGDPEVLIKPVVSIYTWYKRYESPHP